MLSEALLALRPTATMHQLGSESTVPLFNARHLLSGLARSPAVVWAPRLPHLAVAPGVLRAAAHKQAVVGLCLCLSDCQALDARRKAKPGALFRAAAEAARSVENMPPFFLHVQAPGVVDADGSEGQAVRDLLLDCLQAGYTSFGIDLRQCPAGQHAAQAAILLEPILHMELALTVRLPLPMDEELDLEARAGWSAGILASLVAEGIEPDLVLSDGPDQLGDDGWRLAAVLSDAIAPAGLAWSDSAGGPKKWPISPERVGLMSLLGDGVLMGLGGRSDREPDLERMEALAYMQSLEIITKLGAANSASTAVDALVALCE